MNLPKYYPQSIYYFKLLFLDYGWITHLYETVNWKSTHDTHCMPKYLKYFYFRNFYLDFIQSA